MIIAAQFFDFAPIHERLEKQITKFRISINIRLW